MFFISLAKFFGQRQKKTGKMPVHCFFFSYNYRFSKSQGFSPVCFLNAVLKCEIDE
jgi:hypothetical protein